MQPTTSIRASSRVPQPTHLISRRSSVLCCMRSLRSWSFSPPTVERSSGQLIPKVRPSGPTHEVASSAIFVLEISPNEMKVGNESNSEGSATYEGGVEDSYPRHPPRHRRFPGSRRHLYRGPLIG